jgi:type I restriction enzyme M protein
MNSTGVGTIGRVNCVLHDEKSVVDNHVTIIRVKPGVIDPVYLAVFLNSRLGRLQTYKWQSGSSGQLEIYPDEIQKFWVVVPDPKVQEAVRNMFENAYAAFRNATQEAARAEDSVVEIVGD